MGKPVQIDFDAVSNGDCARTIASPLKAGVSSLALCMLLTAAPVYAQEAAAPAETEDNGDAIVVTGIRQSLANAQNIKKTSDTVVDAITAEDIGALPDRSVTEALQRLPGVAINRFAGSNDPDHFSVEGSGVVIRGLNFVRSEFNGRDAFAAGVGGQALNFSDVPSELLGSVVVAKNATADMIEGGLAGTVNLNTRKPFDKKGFQLGINLEANYGDFRKKWTPTGSILISNTFETGIGTFGILGDLSYSRIKSRSDGLQITNFQTRDGSYVVKANAGGTQVCRNRLPSSTNTTTLPAQSNNCNAPSTAGADGFADLLPVAYAPLGGQFRTQEFDRVRDGQALAFQFESIDRNTILTAQFLRSHTTNKWGERTFETGSDLSEYGTQPIGCLQNNRGPAELRTDGSFGDGTTRAECPTGGAFRNYTYNGDNLFQSGYITNPNDGWRGAPNAFLPIGGLQQVAVRRQVDEESTNTDYGLNLKTSLTDRLHISLDADYTKSVKDNLDVSIMGSTFADQELDLTGKLPVVIPHKPAQLNYSWDGTPKTELIAATDAQYFADKRVQFWRSAMDHIEHSTGREYQFRGDLVYDFDDDSFLRQIKFGARYADRDQTVRYTTYNWGVLSEVWAGGSPVSVNEVGSGNVDFHSFPDFFRGQTPGPQGAHYYNGDLTGDYTGAASFAKSVAAAWAAKGSGQQGWVPLAERNGAIAGTPFLASDIQPIAQQDKAVYLMANFGSDDVGGMRLSGNIGVRYVKSDIRSDGQIGVGTQQQLGISQPYAVRCAPVPGPGGVGTVPAGGLCATLNAAQYAALQTFADGTTRFDSARFDYDYFLPSFNARLGVSEDVNLRFAASKVLTRPDNAYLRNFLTTGLDGAGNLTAQAGNPFLKPATAWQFDFTAEWYFARVGSLTFDAFYKDIDNFFYQAVTNRPVTNNGVTQNILVRGPANFNGKGKVKGFEVAYQQTYDFLPGFLNGLGVSANYTYIKSTGLPNTFLNGGNLAFNSTVPPGNLPLEQLSKHNVNATVFYEKGPVSLRAAYNWRSRFLLTASDVIFPYYSIFNEGTGQLDASIFISLGDNVKVGIQGVNLLNEVTQTTQAYTGDPKLLAPRSYFMNDRRFSFIVRGNF